MAKWNPKMMFPMTCRLPNLRCCRMEWILMKRWMTGEKAEMEQDDIDRELFKLTCEWMSVSKLRKQQRILVPILRQQCRTLALDAPTMYSAQK